MKNLKKKAFTLVELLVVIAIIAILAVAGVVGYVVFTKKAAQSNDTSLVSQLNEYMAAASSTDNINTVSDARDLLVQDGIDLASLKLTAKGYRPAFDIASKKFVKVNKESPEDYSGKAEDLFVFVSNEADATTFTNAGYSVYLQNGFNVATLNVKSGVDVGENNGISAINYTSTDTKEVVIRTKGDQCILTVDAPNGDVLFYGFAKKIDVKDVKLTSLHIYGATNQLQVEKGHVAVEETGIVFDVIQVGTTDAGTGATITNNGYIAASTLSEHSAAAKEAAAAAVTGEEIGGDYKISTLAQLESFRDAVNAGNNFAGLTVKLTKDITLKDGWTPIGEGCRQVVQNGSSTVATLFAGTFDGQNHTISNLNNKGFTPNSNRFDADKGCAYGLFALAGNGAEIKNIKLANVNIEFTGSLIGDSVAALVGYSENNITITNVSVISGTITASDAVAGILGRAYISKTTSPSTIYTVTISSCSNTANVTATDNKGGKSAGILAIASDVSGGVNKLSLTLETCTNEGTILGLYSSSVFAYATNNRSNNYVMHNCSSNVVVSGVDKVTVIND